MANKPYSGESGLPSLQTLRRPQEGIPFKLPTIPNTLQKLEVSDTCKGPAGFHARNTAMDGKPQAHAFCGHRLDHPQRH